MFSDSPVLCYSPIFGGFVVAYATPLLENGKATSPLLKLLELTQVPHDGSTASVLTATQTAWRQPTKHSGDIKDTFSHLKQEAQPLFEQLGYVGEQSGTRFLDYKYGMVCGAYILAVRKRLALLKRVWDNEPVRFEELVLCGGKRDAHPVKESLEIINKADGGLQLWDDWQPLKEVPATEDLIMETVLLQSYLPFGWSKNYTVVDTPKRTDRPEKSDPSGEDTLRWWLQTKQPQANTRVLLVYSQPQLRHMEIVARRILEPNGMIVDCIGYEVSGEINVSQVLDTIAKITYEVAKT